MRLLRCLFFTATLLAQPLPRWTPGVLDIHQIHTGRGNATFFLFPDGTTMLLDAGAVPNRTGPELGPQRPNASLTPGEWIARYIEQTGAKAIDYAVLTHFHDDHMGTVAIDSPLAPKGGYRLSGITEVGTRLRIGKIIDRGWPAYDFPAVAKGPIVPNYQAFLKQTNTPAERFQTGRADQITLRHEAYPDFAIQNIAANGEVWTGIGTATRQLFPQNWRTLPSDEQPTENECSIALRLRYGNFRYFTGGDLPGYALEGLPAWHDIETPVAQAVGPVDVAVLNHHGWLDSTNPFFLATLQPRVWVLSAWHATHPDHGVLRRLTSTRLYPGPREIFATTLLDAPRAVFSYMGNKFASTAGHVLIRVAKGGGSYQVFVLDDQRETLTVKSAHGPYSTISR